MLVCWCPYYVIRFPGNVDPDTFWQLLQTYGYTALNDHHPLFDTVLFGLFWKLGDLFSNNSVSVFLYCALQFVITALVFSYARIYFRNLNIPKQVDRFLLAFYAFYPFVAMTAQAMTKDSIYAWCFTLFLVQYIEIVRTAGDALRERKFFFIFVLNVWLTMVTKKTGFYVFVGAMLFALFYIREKKRFLIALVIPVLAYHFLWSGLLMNSFNIVPGSEAEMLSVPSQQIGYLIKDCREEISEEDWLILDSVYTDAQGMGDVYWPLRADATKGRWKKDASSQEKKEFFSWYLKQYIKHPKEMFLSIFALDYPLLCVDDSSLGAESLLFFYDNIPGKEEERPQVEITIAGFAEKEMPVEKMHELIKTCYRPTFIKKLSTLFDEIYLHLTQSCAVLFSKVLWATWLPLFLLFYGFRYNIRKSIMALPALLTTATLAVGPIVLPRYMITSLFIAPILVAVLFLPDSVTKKNKFWN